MTAGRPIHPWGFWQLIWCSPLWWTCVPSSSPPFWCNDECSQVLVVVWNNVQLSVLPDLLAFFEALVKCCAAAQHHQQFLLSTTYWWSCPKVFSITEHHPVLCQCLYWTPWFSDSSDLQNKVLEKDIVFRDIERSVMFRSRTQGLVLPKAISWKL